MDDTTKNLIAETPAASSWVDDETAMRSRGDIFGRVSGGVLWIDDTDLNLDPLGADPSALIAEVNAKGLPSLRGHDPGLPVGRVVAAREFVSPTGVRFVAAIFGLYEDGQRRSFGQLGLDPNPQASSPSILDALSDQHWIGVAVDPREVESAWVDKVLRSAPLRAQRDELSHNAAEPLHELIRVTLSYWILVWNPLVTTVATEAGKNLYRLADQWLRRLWDSLADRRNPVVVLQAVQSDCEVSFLFRGKDVKRNYDAHDALPLAAAQAARLISAAKAAGELPESLVYEFDPQSSRWYPAHLSLQGGRLVSDRAILIAIEQLPTNLSLGVMRRKNKPPQPA